MSTTAALEHIFEDPLPSGIASIRASDQPPAMRTSLNRADFVMLEHLHATWHRARRERLDPQLTIEKEEKRFELVRRYDPTDGRYHSWLSGWRRRLWDERGFSTSVTGEELVRVRSALAHFHAVHSRLPPAQRDIGQYRTEGDLRSLVPTKIAESRRRVEREAIRANAEAQSTTVYLDGPWRILRLDGFDAARFWGLGTKWCTTSDRGTFERYISSGPLFVLLTPSAKYQLHADGEFADMTNGPVHPGAFRNAPVQFQDALAKVRGPIG